MIKRRQLDYAPLNVLNIRHKMQANRSVEKIFLQKLRSYNWFVGAVKIINCVEL